jgi:cytidine deaminase
LFNADRSLAVLDAEFEQLVNEAAAVINPRTLTAHAQAGSVGAAIQAESGSVYVGVCIKTDCGMGFCAEHAAAAAMLTAGENRVLRIVAVNDDGQVLPPCGRCREFISQLHDDNRQTLVMVDAHTSVSMQVLLPYDWREVPGVKAP